MKKRRRRKSSKYQAVHSYLLLYVVRSYITLSTTSHSMFPLPFRLDACLSVCMCAHCACCLWCDERTNDRMLFTKWNWMSARPVDVVHSPKLMNRNEALEIYIYIETGTSLYSTLSTARQTRRHLYKRNTCAHDAHTPAAIIDTCIGYETKI